MSFGSNLEHARPISGSERHAQDLQSQSSVATEPAVTKCLGEKVLLPKVLKSSPFPIGAASRSFPKFPFCVLECGVWRQEEENNFASFV